MVFQDGIKGGVGAVDIVGFLKNFIEVSEITVGEHIAGFKRYDLLYDIIGESVVGSSQRILVDEGCGAVRNNLLFDTFDLTGRKIKRSSGILDGKGAIDGS